MEIYAYIGLALWLAIALTHGLTLAYNTPVIKQEVIEVRYMPQKSEVQSFKHEWEIDEHVFMRPYLPEQMKQVEETAMREAFLNLWHYIPKHMYEFYTTEDYRRGRKIYGIKIKILPPTDGYNFNGDYYTKDNV